MNLKSDAIATKKVLIPRPIREGKTADLNNVINFIYIAVQISFTNDKTKWNSTELVVTSDIMTLLSLPAHTH